MAETLQAAWWTKTDFHGARQVLPRAVAVYLSERRAAVADRLLLGPLSAR